MFGDRYLDATLQAFLRHGVRRTRMTDIADAASVSRTTAYRMLGTVEQAALALLDRELHLLLTDVTQALGAAASVEDVVAACARAMRAVEQHPLFEKVRRDEPVLIGEAIVSRTGAIIDTVTIALAPSFAELVARGVLADDDQRRLLDALVRLGIMCTLHPPAAGHEELLAAILRAGHDKPRRSRRPH